MEKVCPRCKYPQEGINECEYCGLIFVQYKKTKKIKNSNWENTVSKKSSLLNTIIFLIAFIGFLGLVYFWYQQESAKKMAEIEEIRKQKISEQKRKEQQQLKIKIEQKSAERDNKKAISPVFRIQKLTPSVTTRERKDAEKEKKNTLSPVNKTQKMTPSVTKKVVCSKFNVNTVLKGKKLEFWLDTDLPDDTIVMVSVSRLCWKKDSSATYSGSYYGKRSYVRELRRPFSVIIDDNEWRREIEKKQKLLASIGEPFQVSKISDKVELNLTVPINQDNPAFGLRNINLEGTMVTVDHGLRTIREKKMFSIPFGKAIPAVIRAKTMQINR